MLKLVKAALLALAGLGMASAYAQLLDPVPQMGNSIAQYAADQVWWKHNSDRWKLANQIEAIPSSADWGPSPKMVISTPAQAPIPGKTATLPVSAKIGLSASAVAKGLAKAAPLIAAVEVGTVLYDIWADFGFTVADGGVRSTPGSYTVSTGLQYATNSSEGFWRNSPIEACIVGSLAASGNQAVNQFIKSDGNCGWYYPQFPTYLYTSPIITRNSDCPEGFYITSVGCLQTPPISAILTEAEIKEAVSDLLANEGWPTNLAPAFKQALLLPGVPDAILDPADNPKTRLKINPGPGIELDNATVGDPVTATTNKTNPDGSSVTEETTTTTTATVNGDKIDYTQQRTTTTTTRDATGVTTGTTTATTTAPTSPTGSTAAENEDLECGLPGGSPCLIDETGTPEQVDDDGQTKIDEIFQPLMECMTDPLSCLPELPEVNWAFTFPSSCGSISMGGYSQIGLPSIDVCQYQGIIHDLMSMLWAAAGLFGAVGMISGANRQEG